MMQRISLLIISVALAAYSQVLKTKDISPDGSDYLFTGAGDPGGRILSLVIDPNHDDTLYAASEFAGVWKSTTGLRSERDITQGISGVSAPGMTWVQSSKGLRNGLTVNQYSLAVDQNNSKHLLYASGDDDGRPTTAAGAHRLGGLWVSLDGAENWRHEKLCPPTFLGKTYDDGVTAVAFSTGQPFVATTCGIWTNSSSNLDSSSWTLMGGVPFGGGAFLVDGGKKTLLACVGNQVFRTPDLGTKWGAIKLEGNCLALTAVPGATSASDQVLVVRTDEGKTKEVTLVDFSHSTTQDLGFGSVAVNSGSGVPAIAVVRLTGLSRTSIDPGPGKTYDVYAADGLNWYGYNQFAPHWGAMSMHVDTWAMAFPSWYDPAKGHCAAYASNDGGVFFNIGFEGVPLAAGECLRFPWIPVQNGLHALEATQIAAITAGSRPYKAGTLGLTIFVPTGDNDVFVRDVALCPPALSLSCQDTQPLWQNPKDGLGDAGQALVDPPYPGQVLLSRNDTYKALVGTTFTEMIPSLPKGVGFDNGGQGVGTFDLTEVMTTPAELATPVLHADYIAVKDFDTTDCSPTQQVHVVRNTSNPPKADAWGDLSPSDHFLSCDIRKVQAGGGHSKGLNVYVLTTRNKNPNIPKASFNKGRGPGKIYRGVVTAQDAGPTILEWDPASGSQDKPLGEADNFYVNPFDPSELYAVDVTNQVVMVSRDFGATWDKESALTDIATNHGEYRIDCYGSRGGYGSATTPFANACSIAWIAFDVFHPKIRVASAGYGGIAFSRDDGRHWMALDVTHNDHSVSDNLTDLVAGVFYDGETSLAGLSASDRVIYAGLKGHSLIRVEGPFPTLEALNFVYKPASSSIKSVTVDVSTLGETVTLHKDPDGIYRGRALFDSDVHKTLFYFLRVDGTLITDNVYTLTASDIANGVATAPL